MDMYDVLYLYNAALTNTPNYQYAFRRGIINQSLGCGGVYVEYGGGRWLEWG